jgi:anti-sigma factor RsiW
MPTDPPPQRLVAGLWCTQVLEALPDFVEGSLAPEARAAAEAHLAGCDWCERFGGAYAGVVHALPTPAESLPTDVAERLRARLRQL